jgi:hypothetical protein
MELGEAFINVPSGRVLPLMRLCLMIAGSVALAMAAIGMTKRGFGLIEVYCLAYGAVILVWPYSDPRFLIPLVPFLMVYAFIGTGGLGVGQWRRRLIAAWAVFYISAGVASLYYSAEITFAGEKFPLLYGDGSLRPTYCYFLRACPVESHTINPHALKLLETFQTR